MNNLMDKPSSKINMDDLGKQLEKSYTYLRNQDPIDFVPQEMEIPKQKEKYDLNAYTHAFGRTNAFKKNSSFGSSSQTAEIKISNEINNIFSPRKSNPQIITNKKDRILTLQSKSGEEILRFEDNGDIYIKEEFVTNDFQIIEGFREFLKNYKLHP